MKFDANIAGFILGLVSASSGWVMWWITKVNTDKLSFSQKAAEAAKKEYAAQRDFEHLKNNFKQMSDALAHGLIEIDKRFDATDKELLRIEAYLIQGKLTERE